MLLRSPGPAEVCDTPGLLASRDDWDVYIMTTRSSTRCSPFWGLGLTDHRRSLTQIQLIERGDVALWRAQCLGSRGPGGLYVVGGVRGRLPCCHRGDCRRLPWTSAAAVRPLRD